MNLQEKTLAELAQGAEGFATLKIDEEWQRGLVFAHQGERRFCFVASDDSLNPDFLIVCSYRILNNGVKVGSEILAIPAAELKALLSEVENG